MLSYAIGGGNAVLEPSDLTCIEIPYQFKCQRHTFPFSLLDSDSDVSVAWSPRERDGWGLCICCATAQRQRSTLGRPCEEQKAGGGWEVNQLQPKQEKLSSYTQQMEEGRPRLKRK